MPVDLHIHSTASDGLHSPAEVVSIARGAGVHTIALADHDSVGGVDEAIAAGAECGVRVVPAVELSATLDGRAFHLLGYFVDHHHRTLGDYLLQMREVRVARARAMVAALTSAGHDVDFQTVVRLSAGGSVGRLHVASALVAAGSVPSIGAAFRTMIGRGGPFYVPKPTVSAADAISVIRDARGLAILAHPYVSGVVDLVDRLCDDCLDGIEVFHAEHSHEMQVRLTALASDRGLLMTGGSDFHGEGIGGTLGSGGTPDDVVGALETAARARRGETIT
jgi:hypothetical protein